MKILPTIAYFSMEIALRSEMPTYCGGLGVLAGDVLRAAADLELPMMGVTLLHRKGYFQQQLDSCGNQIEKPQEWNPEQFLERLPEHATLEFKGRKLEVCAWRFWIQGSSGHKIPVYLLDTFLPGNDPFDQTLTDHLYGGDSHYRLCQEALLGLGGIAILRALKIDSIQCYHMNEGHSALLTLALLEEEMSGEDKVTDPHRNAVRRKCVFTTHTPVPAGHDLFSFELVQEVLSAKQIQILEQNECCSDRVLNMTHLALSFSRYVNGVAMRHGEVSKGMFPHYPIDSITNGVHLSTWITEPFSKLYDLHIPAWRQDYLYLRHAFVIPEAQIAQAHQLNKQRLFAEVEKRSGTRLNPDYFTLGFARRMTAYKRPELLFADIPRLKSIASQAGPLQILYAGKAHPQDKLGKELIRSIFGAKAELGCQIPVVFLEDYDMDWAKLLCAGVDLWLNTPQKPQEASGTSGMKAALNGVPSLSTLDGWWIEGHLEGVTGWSIGKSWGEEYSYREEIESLYFKLEKIILPLFYENPRSYEEVMRSTIAHNGSFFNSHRMVQQYLKHAYTYGNARESHVLE